MSTIVYDCYCFCGRNTLLSSSCNLRRDGLFNIIRTQYSQATFSSSFQVTVARKILNPGLLHTVKLMARYLPPALYLQDGRFVRAPARTSPSARNAARIHDTLATWRQSSWLFTNRLGERRTPLRKFLYPEHLPHPRLATFLRVNPDPLLQCSGAVVPITRAVQEQALDLRKVERRFRTK